MLVQVYIKNEPLTACDLLVAREDAVLSIPAQEFARLQEHDIRTVLVKPQENMGMKAAITIAKAIREAEAISSPVQVQCPDKAVLEGICSMDYEGPAGGPIKCVPAGTKPSPPSRPKPKTKPKAPGQAAADAAKAQEKAEALKGTQAGGAGEAPAADEGTGRDAPAPAQAEPDIGELLKDPEFASGNELPPPAPDPVPEAPDPAVANAPKVMKILKECGVPSGQVPGVLEALREAMDASITLPMQVKLKLAKDGASDIHDPEATAKLVAPRFDELKSLLKEIDDANAAKP